jgi:hypothetical protein
VGAGGVIDLAEVWSMLDHCAPGHTRSATTHYWCIRFGGKTYPSFPLGAHGRRKNPTVQVGHVRAMVRQLGISACAAGQIEGL